MDPRDWQIASLGTLLLYGLCALDFEVSLAQVVVSVGVALLAQNAFGRWYGLPRFEPRSALITGLSLGLLLRCSSLWVAAAGALVAIGSKFVLAVPEAGGNGRKHLWNPSCLGVVVMIASGQAWVSPGQWGNAALGGFLVACLGGMVIRRTARADITWAFLASWLVLLYGRSIWLGEPLTIPTHRLQSGALLLFTFFMISDPRTAPDSRVMRVAFAALVAFVGWWIQYLAFRTNGLLWALAALAPLVPLLDRLHRAPAFRWRPAELVSPAPSLELRSAR